MSVLPPSRTTRYLIVAVRWILILTIVYYTTFTLIRSGSTLLLHPIYTASTYVRVPAAELVAPRLELNPSPDATRPEFENEIRAPDFLLSVIKDLGLDKTWAKRIYRLEGNSVPDVDALTHMERLLDFQVSRTEDYVIITAASDVPQESAQIANAVSNRYQVMHSLDRLVNPQDQVRVLKRAAVPTAPIYPNPTVVFYVATGIACLASLMAASFVEIILLFRRAGQREGN